MGAAEPLRAVPKTEPALSPLCAIELAERRKHALVHNYWRTLKGDRPFPSIWDLDPFEIADAGPNSVMLDLSKDRENPEIFVGDALRYDSGSDNDVNRRADAQALLSSVLNNYRTVLGKSGPVVFEDRCAADGGRTLSCFGTLFPFSSTGSSIDYVFGLLSWKDVVDEAGSVVADSAEAPSAIPAFAEGMPEAEVSGDTEPAQAVADDAVLIAAISDHAAPDEAAPEEAVSEEAVVDEVATPDIALDEVIPVDAAPEEPVLEDLAVVDAVPEEAVIEDAAHEEMMLQAADGLAVAEEALSDDVAPGGAVSDDLAGTADPLLDEAASNAAAPDQPEPGHVLPETAPPEEVPVDESLVDEPASDHAMRGDAVFDEHVSDASTPDRTLVAGPWPGHSNSGEQAPDIRSHFAAFGKAVFAAVKHIAVADRDVNYGPIPRGALPGHDMSAQTPTDQVAPDAAEPDVPPADVLADDARSGELIEPLDGIALPGDVAPEDAMAADMPADVAVPDHAVIVPMMRYDDMMDDAEPDGAGPDEPVADAGLADLVAPDLAVIVPMVRYDSMWDDAESDDAVPAAVPVEAPEPVVAATDGDTASASSETAATAVSFSQQYEGVDVSNDLRRCFDPEARSAVPAEASADDDLRKQLAIAQAIASAAPDADYHSRASLYIALGHAYDFALAVEAEPEAYRAILDDAGLEHHIQAPMTPLVELVFGAGYDRKRLNDFAAMLSRARRVNLPRGSLASYLEFLEAGLAIVAPV